MRLEREHRGGVDAGRPHAGGIAPGEPVQVLHDQHPAGHQVGMGRGTTMERWPVRRTPRRCRACSGLRAGSRAPRRWSRRTARPGPGGLVSAATGMRPTSIGAIQRHGGDVEAAPSEATSRRWTLTTTRSPVRRVAACTWAMEAEAIGHAVEGDEHVGQRVAEVLLDGAPDGRERLGRHPVAQQPELVHQLLGEDALARRHDLAELDVGRPQALEGRPQAPGQAGPRGRRVPRSWAAQPTRARAQAAADGDHPGPGRQPAADQ